MIEVNWQQLIDRWLDGDLPAEEEANLRRILEGVPESVTFLADRSVLHGMLADVVELGALTDLRQQPRRWVDSPIAWTVSAVSICLILFAIVTQPRAVASPAEVVQKALLASRTMIDRHYEVRVETEAPWGQVRSALRRPPRASELWVRGNQFVQRYEIGEETLVWGRNDRGEVWFTMSGISTVVFQASEVPEVLQDLCELRTLDVQTLLNSLLIDFDLEYVERPGRIVRILARPRSDFGRSKYAAIEIEIETESLLVRNVRLERAIERRHVATVTFSFEEMTSRKDALYERQSYVKPDGEVFERGSMRAMRSERLRQFLKILRESQLSGR